MGDKGLLDALPLPFVFVVTLVVVLLAVEGGYRLGLARERRADAEKEAPVGAMVGSSLGLLAFLLAFTFGLAASRFDTRKQLVLKEANSIGTTYLRAGMLAEPQRTAVKNLLREYVTVRLKAAETGDIRTVVVRSEEIQGGLWEHAVAAGEASPASIMVGLFVQSLNETIDVHSERLAAVRNRVPGVVWFVLYAMAVVALAGMGFHGALSRSSRSIAVVGVGITFSLVLWLIADLDRPTEGSLVVSQQPLEELLKSFGPAKP